MEPISAVLESASSSRLGASTAQNPTTLFANSATYTAGGSARLNISRQDRSRRSIEKASNRALGRIRR